MPDTNLPALEAYNKIRESAWTASSDVADAMRDELLAVIASLREEIEIERGAVEALGRSFDKARDLLAAERAKRCRTCGHDPCDLYECVVFNREELNADTFGCTEWLEEAGADA